MSPHVHRLAVLSLLLIANHSVTPAAYRGYVELPWTPTFCGQESHFLTNPCTGDAEWILDDRGAISMDGYLCQYVDVNGPNVGVECFVTEPTSVSLAQPPCPIPFEGLWMTSDAPPRLNWDHVTCADSHDVIRGELPGPTPSGAHVDLGRVTCLADDVPQAAWWYIQGPADPESPPVGRAYFYLARALGLPYGDTTYGHSSDGLEEVPLSGDCRP
jgi:hypothetical protein